MESYELIAEDGTRLRVRVVPQTVPTTANPIHPSATHIDALGMPVAGVGSFPYHPTPCCGAAASISDGPMYCKSCYAEVDDAFGNVPVEPFRPIAEPDEMKTGECDHCGRESWLLRWTPMKNGRDEYWCEECRRVPGTVA